MHCSVLPLFLLPSHRAPSSIQCIRQSQSSPHATARLIIPRWNSRVAYVWQKAGWWLADKNSRKILSRSTGAPPSAEHRTCLDHRSSRAGIGRHPKDHRVGWLAPNLRRRSIGSLILGFKPSISIWADAECWTENCRVWLLATVRWSQGYSTGENDITIERPQGDIKERTKGMFTYWPGLDQNTVCLADQRINAINISVSDV